MLFMKNEREVSVSVPAVIGCWPFGKCLVKCMHEQHEDFNELVLADLATDPICEFLEQAYPESNVTYHVVSKKENEEEYVRQLSRTTLVFVAVWSRYMNLVLDELVSVTGPWTCIVNVAKALSPNSLTFWDEFLHRFPKESGVTYATLAWWMAAYDIEAGKHVRATVACRSKNDFDRIDRLLWSPWFQMERSSDIKGVELAWILKNIISLRAWFLLAEHGSLEAARSYIDIHVQTSTQQIKDHASVLWSLPETFDHTYCRDHPEYGDIRTSCYGNTRNMKLWMKRFELEHAWTESITWKPLLDAKAEFDTQRITVEWMNSLLQIKEISDHELLVLPFVSDMMKEIS